MPTGLSRKPPVSFRTVFTLALQENPIYGDVETTKAALLAMNNIAGIGISVAAAEYPDQFAVTTRTGARDYAEMDRIFIRDSLSRIGSVTSERCQGILDIKVNRKARQRFLVLGEFDDGYGVWRKVGEELVQ